MSISIEDIIFEEYRHIEQNYLKILVEQLSNLSLEDIDELSEMIITNENIEGIIAQLQEVTKKVEEEIPNIVEEATAEVYEDSEKYFKAKKKVQVDLKENTAVKSVMVAVSDSMGSTIADKVKRVNIRDSYKQAVNEAVQSLREGEDTYRSVYKKIINEKASQGIKYIETKSGRKINLASAVRKDILDELHHLKNETHEEMGKEFGADGYQISSHKMPAPDHKDIDGNIYSMEEWKKIEKNLKRKVGDHNCDHLKIPVIMRHAVPLFTPEELAEKRKKQAEKHNGKTLYEWSQVQRQIERQVRVQRDIVKSTKDDPKTKELAKEARQKIKKLKAKYDKIVDEVDISSYWDRTYL